AVGISDFARPRRVRPRRGLVDHARRHVAERLMRPLFIVDAAKDIEPLLLGAPTGGWRVAAFELERPMQALVTAVLARLTSFDPFRLDAELDPPHRESAQAPYARTRKRWSIVAADRARQAVFSESRLHQRLYPARIGPPHHLAPEQIAAVGITDRQRFAPPAVAGAEPTLEVDRPSVVRARALGKGRRVGRDPRARFPRHDQFMPPQD